MPLSSTYCYLELLVRNYCGSCHQLWQTFTFSNDYSSLWCMEPRKYFLDFVMLEHIYFFAITKVNNLFNFTFENYRKASLNLN